MSKFVVVKSAPELNEDEIVVEYPDFVAEIKEAERFAGNLGKRKLTSLFYLRAILSNIVRKYENDPTSNPNIPYSLYEGIEFKNEKEVSDKVLIRLLNKHYPDIFYKYLDFKIKQRPANTKVVFFVGPSKETKVFRDNGLDEALLNEVRPKNNDNKKQRNNTEHTV